MLDRFCICISSVLHLSIMIASGTCVKAELCFEFVFSPVSHLSMMIAGGTGVGAGGGVGPRHYVSCLCLTCFALVNDDCRRDWY